MAPNANAAVMAAGGERRQLPYEALDPQWEAREFHKFRAAARQQAPYGAYLFGRLMQSDLHQSCRPALPSDVAKLNGSTIEGMCILQVVDAANIGANYEHRTEFSAAGPARTLKLGLTDGHQLVFGFEFGSLPQFSVNVARGTKIVVENVPVKHGMLLLAPDNCQLLETSSADRAGRGNGQVQQNVESSGVSAGAYSAALVTSQFNTSQQPTPPIPPAAATPTIAPMPSSSLRSFPARNASATTVQNPQSATRVSMISTIPVPPRSSVVPSVFVDVHSSDEDMDSDTTDPMVEHLFYSPKTPRQVPDVTEAGEKVPRSAAPSRKRPRSPSLNQQVTVVAQVRPQAQHTSMTASTVVTVSGDNAAERSSSASLLGHDRNSIPQPATARPPPPDPTRPFQYFTARLSTLSASTQATATRFLIRACIKSVVGFQFNTGRYQLRVSVEDCTATKEADVAEDFVTRLMGVPCSEFLQTMKTKVQVAHGWAATMQFALMTLEGVMTFEKGAAGSASLLLIDCRDYQSSDTQELLQRVKASMSYTHR